jgi:DNA-binding NarL/FixJ family response regulator
MPRKAVDNTNLSGTKRWKKFIMRQTVEAIHSKSRSHMSRQELEREHCKFLKATFPPAFDRMGKEQFVRAIERQELLAPRQLEVARLVAEGFENREIADQLGITVYSVKKHVEVLMQKANVDSRTRIAQWFVGL